MDVSGSDQDGFPPIFSFAIFCANSDFSLTNGASFTSPADVRGTAMLIYDYENKDDDMWIYMPAIRKIRRIVSSEKGKNFMGSEFTNADMSKPNMNDFDYRILSSETYSGDERLECFPIRHRFCGLRSRVRDYNAGNRQARRPLNSCATDANISNADDCRIGNARAG